MALLAFDGTLKLGECCATPANRCRAASLPDIEAWLKGHPEEQDLLRNWLDAQQRL